MKIKNILRNYFILLSISAIIFAFQFILTVEEPNYFICNEMKSYNYELFNNSIEFLYPESCDQEAYHSGFSNLRNILKEDFNYQARPLYFIPVNIIYNLLKIFNLSETTNLLISTFLFQNIVALFVLTILSDITSYKKNKQINNFIIISLVILLSPLFKWGLFDPSHQLLTFVVIIFFPYLLSKKVEINYSNAILVGLLFLLHRSFLIGYFWYLFFSDYKNIFQHIRYRSKYFLFSLVPYISYNLYFYLFLNQKPYDANSLYWGQFVWLYDFIRGKVRYQSEWHCVTIPKNFQCYLSDNLNTIMYLAIPIVLLIFNNLINNSKIQFKNNSYQYYVISLSFFIYVFWSFIGWYPPIRFSYYSIGNLVIILFALQLLNIENNLIKIITLSSYISFTLYLNHWNDPNTVTINSGIYLSIYLLFFLAIITFFNKNKNKNK